MSCVLNCDDILFEIIKFIDIKELYKYKTISKNIYSICNRIYHRKNLFFLFHMKHYIKPVYFTIIENFNNKCYYKSGLYIRLSKLHDYLVMSNYDIKNLTWFIMHNKVIESILFKKIEMSFNSIENTLHDIHTKLDKFC